MCISSYSIANLVYIVVCGRLVSTKLSRAIKDNKIICLEILRNECQLVECIVDSFQHFMHSKLLTLRIINDNQKKTFLYNPCKF